ncbi:UDP-N-acetylmuramate dehydrogenase [candidate division CSSED10-310 bacterium]|uniref:UDP-N-acetylenolpyruvoylglucosamine reductase n=1 Tax=candidate division CSSED10-310 bacterium TaxID=2855610 RepID=A0ABV6YY57_UNCC1
MVELSWEAFYAAQEGLAQSLRGGPGQSVLWMQPAAELVTFKTGGNLGGLILPRTIDDICDIVEICSFHGIPWLILGLGSNILFRDGGFPGLVIKMADNFSQILIESQTVTVKAGTTMRELAYTTARQGLQGLEFAVDIPGTVGGGLFMNAGMYDESLGKMVNSVLAIDTISGKLTSFSQQEGSFDYRSSRFQTKQEIIVQATFQLLNEDSAVLLGKIEAIILERQQKFPLEYPNAGSIFKRPVGNYAGALIEQAGLKGKRCGGAMVSPKHANFIINVTQATATDIENLMEEIQAIVWNQFQIQLQPELKILGIKSSSH